MKFLILKTPDHSGVFYFAPLEMLELEKVITFDEDHFDYPWSDKNWKIAQGDRQLYLFAIGESESVDDWRGMALYQVNPFENSVHLLKIMVPPEFQNQGVGKELLKKSLDWFQVNPDFELEYCHLEVASDNAPAKKLYESQFFREIRRVESYYKDGKTAVFYQRRFSPKTYKN